MASDLRLEPIPQPTPSTQLVQIDTETLLLCGSRLASMRMRQPESQEIREVEWRIRQLCQQVERQLKKG